MTDITFASKVIATLIEKTFYPGRSFQLTVNTGINSKSTYAVKVESLDINWLVLSLLEGKDQIGQIKSGANVIGICKNEDGVSEYIFNSQIAEIKLYTNPRIFVKRPVQLHSSHRRFFRLDVNLPFTCFIGQQKITGKITNLSAGGMCCMINYDQDIAPGATLVCQINLSNVSKPILVVGKVARVRILDEKKELALCFDMINKNDEALITNYLFQYQRRQINENRKKAPEDNTKATEPVLIRYLAG